MSWHTKYRPRAVAELHLTEVRQTLQSLMKSGSFPQVFLCAGPKGTGKTSTSRIIGAMLNDPRNEEAVASLFFTKSNNATAAEGAGKNTSKVTTKNTVVLLEPESDTPLANTIFNGQSFIVQEMDAASNRGIDDVRQLKERVSLPPQEGVMAVYILDEVHMLTKEAFNALLKLLEEPPAHAVFILATTELHKVPDTIQSRCAILPFRKANEEELAEALSKVLKEEKIKITKDALDAVIAQADGSFRDAIKHLEMVVTASKADEEITLEIVESILQTGFSEYVPKIIAAVVAKEEQTLVSNFKELRSQGVVSSVLHAALLHYLHKQLLLAVTNGDAKATFSQRITHFLLNELQSIPTITVEPLPLLAIELKLLDIIYRAQDRSGGGNVPNQPPGKSSSSSSTSPTPSSPNAEIQSKDPISVHQNIELPDEHIDTRPLLNAWSEFIEAVEVTNSSLGAVLRSAKPLPEKSNGIAKVEVYYQFHRDQLMQPKFMDILKKCAKPFIGGTPTFEFIIGSTSVPIENVAAIADSILM